MKLGSAHRGSRDRTTGHEERPDVPGYRVLERLGGDGRGGVEVWKAEGPGGFHAALRFVRLTPGVTPDDVRGLDLLRRARHPNLLSAFGSWRVGGSLVLATELPDRSLWDRFLEARGAGGDPASPATSWSNTSPRPPAGSTTSTATVRSSPTTRRRGSACPTARSPRAPSSSSAAASRSPTSTPSGSSARRRRRRRPPSAAPPRSGGSTTPPPSGSPAGPPATPTSTAWPSPIATSGSAASPFPADRPRRRRRAAPPRARPLRPARRRAPRPRPRPRRRPRPPLALPSRAFVDAPPGRRPRRRRCPLRRREPPVTTSLSVDPSRGSFVRRACRGGGG